MENYSANDSDISMYFRVLHPGGLVVRAKPTLLSEPTGRVIRHNSLISTRENMRKEEDNYFVKISEDGWVLIKKGPLNACSRLKEPEIMTGEWAYEVINPLGAQLATSSNILDEAKKNDALHKSGKIIKASRKFIDLGTSITVVELDFNLGWIFEHSLTGEVLNRQDKELILLPLDNSREFRDMYAKVICLDGAPILITPVGTSLSKGKLEKDKIFRCWETLSVPIYQEEDNTIIGVMQYLRLKGDEGWVAASRRYNDKSTGDMFEIVEVPSPSLPPTLTPSLPPTLPPSSSQASIAIQPQEGKAMLPFPRRKVLTPMSYRTLPDRESASEILSSTSSDGQTAGLDSDSFDKENTTEEDDEGDSQVLDQVTEDCPSDAWYRVIYPSGIRLRATPNVHDVLDIIVPFGCYVRASHRVSSVSKAQPNDGVGDGIFSEVFDKKEKDNFRKKIDKGRAMIFLKIVECLGANLDLNQDGDAWIFESITNLNETFEREIIKAAETVLRPRVAINEIFLMVLHQSGISLRFSPHMDSVKLERIIYPYECCKVYEMITSNNMMESFGKLDVDTWLPCSTNGMQVAVQVPLLPYSKENSFLITMKMDCQTLVGPYPGSPYLSEVFPKGTILLFDYIIRYEEDDGSVLVSNIFYRLKQNNSFSPGDRGFDVWVRRNDDILNILEKQIKV